MNIKRFLKTKNFTIGSFELNNRTYYTLELPWKDNVRNVSCIPEGEYLVTPHGWGENSKKKFKRVYHINNVPDRAYILIHIGNYTKDTSGCILIGTGFSVNENEGKLLYSRTAMDDLRSIFGENSFKIKIEG